MVEMNVILFKVIFLVYVGDKQSFDLHMRLYKKHI